MLDIFFPIGSKNINNRNLDKINPQSTNSCTYLILYFFLWRGLKKKCRIPPILRINTSVYYYTQH